DPGEGEWIFRTQWTAVAGRRQRDIVEIAKVADREIAGRLDCAKRAGVKSASTPTCGRNRTHPADRPNGCVGNGAEIKGIDARQKIAVADVFPIRQTKRPVIRAPGRNRGYLAADVPFTAERAGNGHRADARESRTG